MTGRSQSKHWPSNTAALSQALTNSQNTHAQEILHLPVFSPTLFFPIKIMTFIRCHLNEIFFPLITNVF